MKAIDQRKNVSILDPRQGQFLYLGRWVDKEHFCAFVYDKNDNETLAKNYNEFEKLTTSGIWFASKQEAHDAVSPKVKGKPKDDITVSDRK